MIRPSMLLIIWKTITKISFFYSAQRQKCNSDGFLLSRVFSLSVKELYLLLVFFQLALITLKNTNDEQATALADFLQLTILLSSLMLSSYFLWYRVL